MSDKRMCTNWIEKLKETCIQEGLHTGIYPSIALAMTLLESDAGSSNLAINHYNIVGMSMPEHLVGTVAVFWDGSVYRRENYVSNRSWADYTQAGSFDAGIVLCIRHFGMNFWSTRIYGEKGVLSHISSGLTPKEAEEDALLQLRQLAPIYAPSCDNEINYEDTVSTIIADYDLFRYDREFLSRGGWDGTSPYCPESFFFRSEK